jgi:long-chain fatty acid transport protein
MKGVMKKVVRLGGLGIIALAASNAFSAGLKLEMQSSSVLADSGDAAVVEDAGTNWYNSAGLVYLPHQVVGSAIDVYTHSTFRGNVTSPNVYNFPPASLPTTVASAFSQTGKATSHPNSVLPALHYNFPFTFKNRELAFGLTVAPAWGLAEDYGSSGITRYNVTRVYTRTIDVAPSLAAKIDCHWSVGAGPDIHYFSLSTTNHARTQNVLALPGAASDSIARSSGNSWNYGGHAGVLYRYDDATRVGFNYRSKIVQSISGYSDFNFSGGGPLYGNSTFKLRLVLPPVSTLSVYHDLNSRWAVMGTVSYEQWSVFKNLQARNYMLANNTGLNISVPQNMTNTFDFGLGAHYVLNDMWMLRANVKYLPTPTNDNYRDLNYPDAKKLGFQIGARTHMSKKLMMDIFYGHVFTWKAPIAYTNTVSGVTTNGNVNTSLDIVGAQLVYNI